MSNAKRNSLHADRIEVFQSPLHCDGVIATSAINDQDTIYLEKPHYFLQSMPNRRSVLACGGCARFLGSIGLQLKVLQKCVTREELLGGTFTGVSEPFLPLSDSLLPCHAGCGELYCSPVCRDMHWANKGHKFLCTGHIDESQADSHPLIAFKIHAVQTNEIFLMIADIFAELCAMYETHVIGHGQPREQVLPYIQNFFDGFVRQRWWEAAQPPKGQSKAKFVKTLKQLVSDSYSMLADALPLEAFGLSQVLSEDFMARCIGMFEQNNVGVRLRNPIAILAAEAGPELAEKLLSEVQAVAMVVESECMDACEEEDEEYEDIDEDEEDEPDGEAIDVAEEDGTTLATGEGEEVDSAKPMALTGDERVDRLRALIDQYGEDELFPPLDGTAFYFLTCKVNHSCLPNCLVTYASHESLGLVAQMNALRAIAPGEELVQSYIDQSLPVPAREQQLAEYGFKCTCAKCMAERALLTGM